MYTRSMRAAVEAKDKWLAGMKDVACVDKVALQNLKKKWVNAPPPATVDDVVQDFPHGPLGEDRGGDADEDCDASDTEDEEMSDGGEIDGAEELAAGAAGLGDLVHEAVGMAPHAGDEEALEDALEQELQLDTDSDPAAAGTEGAGPSSEEVVRPFGEDLPSEPQAGAGRFVTAGGKVMRVHLSHRASLGMIQSRLHQTHLLTIHPDTGESVIPYPQAMRIPRAHPEFQIDLVSLMHDSGDELMDDVKATLHGSLPVIIARARYLAAGVRTALKLIRMCMVQGCPNRPSTKVNDRSKLTCDPHLKVDLRLKGTELTVRYCHKCHGHRDAPDFRVGQGSETVGGVCLRCGVKEELARDPEAPLVLHGHPGAWDVELESGKDCDGTYIRERRAAAQRLQTFPGEALFDPLGVYAVRSDERENNVGRCVRIGCPHQCKSPDVPTLCFDCCGVRALLHRLQ